MQIPDQTFQNVIVAEKTVSGRIYFTEDGAMFSGTVTNVNAPEGMGPLF